MLMMFGPGAPGDVPSGASAGARRKQAFRFAIKVAATWLLCALAWALWSSPAGTAALGAYVNVLGLGGLAAIFAAFLAVVALYCRTLERCLSLIQARHRTAEPRSVWLMFLIPYNFIEDFFIVASLARSLRLEASANPRLHGIRSYGQWCGGGWCLAQLVSLVPGTAGEIAGVTAAILWAVHWRFIAKVNRLLARG